MSRGSEVAQGSGERKKNKCVRHRDNAFPPPNGAQFFHRGGLDADPIGRDLQNFRDPGLHGRTVRSDLWRLRQESHIDVHDPAAALSHPARGIREEQV